MPAPRRLGAALALALAAAPLLPSLSAASPASRGVSSPALHAAPVSATVLVYGGTPAGVMAAIAARRNGAASVVLVEPSAHLGGMMSSGLTFTDTGDRTTIGGISREFFSRMEAIEGKPQGRYNFQARNAEKVLKAMLAEAGVVVRYGTALVEAPGAVATSGGRITLITATSGETFTAQVFVDASYEGDLMARAGVSYIVGRESSGQYNEALGGVRPASTAVSDASGLALGFPVSAPGPVGSADARIQSSNFRLCFTINPSIFLPFRLPPVYDPAAYAVVARYIDERTASGGTPRLSWLLSIAPTVNGKYDVNEFGAISIGVPGANYAYPDGSYAVRAEISAWYRSYTEGFLYFLANDARVPSAIRNEMGSYGLCKDEFTDNGNWPYLLYLREGRRMVGRSVLTAHDIQAIRSKPDIIAIGSYRMDVHTVSRYVDAADRLMAEGSFPLSAGVKYAIPYSVMTPQRGEATNLLVPVTSSASHVAQASVRMEPQYMMVGEAAGAAAALAAAGGSAVQDVSVAALQARLTAAGAVLTDPGDIGSSLFYGDIVWAYHADVIEPCAGGRFCPTAAVTREMMADFLVRALDLPPASQDYFTDDEASPFEDAINRLAKAGITKGCTTTLYCPLASVTRDQMASFLVRAFHLPPTSTDYFTDDEASIHESDINRLAAAHITAGCGAGKFCPAKVVTRGEMMAFLHRAAD
jgi:hypothetical protein